jgi:hypothetical protein
MAYHGECSLGLKAGFIFFALGSVATFFSFLYVPETAKYVDD